MTTTTLNTKHMAQAAPPKAATRIVYFDGARGYLLSMMYLAHSFYTLHQPVFALHHGRYLPVMDGEFFVLISGFVCAIAYLGAFRRNGVSGATHAVFSRLKWVYLYQVAVALGMLLLFRAFGQVEVEPGYLADFETPLWRQTLDVLTLKERPPYLDILLLYMALMAFIPLALLALERGRKWLLIAILVGLWLFVRSGLDHAADTAVQSVFPYSKLVGVKGYFHPFSYAIVFYTGFIAGYFFKKGVDLSASGLLKLRMSVFTLSIALIGLFAAMVIATTIFPSLEPIAVPERTQISVIGFACTIAVSYAVYFLLAIKDPPPLLRLPARAAHWFFGLPLLVMLGRNSLFVYSMHIVAVFIPAYVLIVMGLSDSTAMRIVSLFAGYAGLVGLTLLKNRFLPTLP